MVTVKDMMRRFERLDVPDVAAEGMQETKGDFLEQQRQQLYAGKDKKGKDIKPFYKPATIARKKKKGQPTDRVTLKDTGFFYNSLYLTVSKGGGTFGVISSDVKSKWLLQRYGPNILGLGSEYKTSFIVVIRRVVMAKIRSILKL